MGLLLRIICLLLLISYVTVANASASFSTFLPSSLLVKLTRCLDQRCKRNEEYQECGTACPQTCADLTYPISTDPRVCPALCVPGCFCKKGYYRSKAGHCVRPQRCCKGWHERYSTCGSACVETCNYVPDICTEQCVFGCFCKSSAYIRKDNSTNSPCIRRSRCPQ